MPTVKLAPSLPTAESDDNGLSVIADALVADPHRTHFIVAAVETKATLVDHTAKDARTPTAHITAVEVVKGLDASIVQALLSLGREQRTGQGMTLHDQTGVDLIEEMHTVIRDARRKAREEQNLLDRGQALVDEMPAQDPRQPGYVAFLGEPTGTYEVADGIPDEVWGPGTGATDPPADDLKTDDAPEPQ